MIHSLSAKSESCYRGGETSKWNIPKYNQHLKISLSFHRMMSIQGMMDTGPGMPAFSLLSRNDDKEAPPAPPPPPGRSGKETLAGPTSAPGTLHPTAPGFLKFHPRTQFRRLQTSRRRAASWEGCTGGGSEGVEPAEPREAEEAGPPGNMGKANSRRSLLGRSSWGGWGGRSPFCPRLAGVGPQCRDTGGGARPRSEWEARFRARSRLQTRAAVWDWAAQLHLRPPSGVTRPPPPPALPSLPPGRPAGEELLGRQRWKWGRWLPSRLRPRPWPRWEAERNRSAACPLLGPGILLWSRGEGEGWRGWGDAPRCRWAEPRGSRLVCLLSVSCSCLPSSVKPRVKPSSSLRPDEGSKPSMWQVGTAFSVLRQVCSEHPQLCCWGVCGCPSGKC